VSNLFRFLACYRFVPKISTPIENDVVEARKQVAELAKGLTIEKAKRKKARKNSFNKGWDKTITAASAQIEYVKNNFFKDGWSTALKEVGTTEDSELF